jgi:hypothetical protein
MVIPGMVIPGMAIPAVAVPSVTTREAAETAGAAEAAEAELPATTSMNSIAANMGTCCMGWITALAPPDVMDLPPEVTTLPARRMNQTNGTPMTTPHAIAMWALKLITSIAAIAVLITR